MRNVNREEEKNEHNTTLFMSIIQLIVISIGRKMKHAGINIDKTRHMKTKKS